jgi:hypothetical protein
MKQLFAICAVLACLSMSVAQGLQGNITLDGKATVAITGHLVFLTWNASQNATSYNIYRGTAHGGPYLKVASGVVGTTYADVEVTHNQTLYYVTTAVTNNNESGYSNETVAAIP